MNEIYTFRQFSRYLYSSVFLVSNCNDGSHYSHCILFSTLVAIFYFILFFIFIELSQMNRALWRKTNKLFVFFFSSFDTIFRMPVVLHKGRVIKCRFDHSIKSKQMKNIKLLQILCLPPLWNASFRNSFVCFFFFSFQRWICVWVIQ